MKKFLIFLTSIALLCSLCGCTSSVNKEATVPLETVPATEASASGQKLQLKVEPTGEIGFTRVPAEQLGKEKVDLAYARLSGVNITLDGKTEPLADAIGSGKITGAEIFAYARMDAEAGYCKEGYTSEQGLTRFVYTYPEYALEMVYDIFEGSEGKNVLINEITVADSTQSLFDSDSFYVDESSRWGYFLDREDWGLEFTVKAVTPESLTVTYTQKQTQELGELTCEDYIMFAEVEGARDEFVTQTGRDAPGFPIAITSDGSGEITFDWSEMAGKLNPGTYYVRIGIRDNYDPEKVPANVTKRYSKQSYCVEFTVEP